MLTKLQKRPKEVREDQKSNVVKNELSLSCAENLLESEMSNSPSLFIRCAENGCTAKTTKSKCQKRFPPPLPNNVSLDLLATKPIYSLPGPLEHVPFASPYPDELPEFQSQLFDKNQPEPSEGEMLREHIGHWKEVKKCFNEHNEKRRERYAPSIQLLETVFGITQQTQ
ncbi:Protein LIN37 family-containing protein [Aphelenchoides bicaudatus]|nr:Protein LIN37 family-containing protein [Aphelenchoides bicaudatus]